MKKIIILLFMISNFLFVSCERNYNLETNDGIENTKQKIFEAFGGKKRILTIKINTYSSFFDSKMISNFHDATISFIENNKVYSQTLLEQNLENPIEQNNLIRLKIKPEIDKSFEISNIKFEDIPIKIIEAKKMIEKPEKYASMRLANWEAWITKNNKIIYRFRILCNIKKPELAVFSNVSYDFKIDENGKLQNAGFGE